MRATRDMSVRPMVIAALMSSRSRSEERPISSVRSRRPRSRPTRIHAPARTAARLHQVQRVPQLDGFRAGNRHVRIHLKEPLPWRNHDPHLDHLRTSAGLVHAHPCSAARCSEAGAVPGRHSPMCGRGTLTCHHQRMLRRRQGVRGAEVARQHSASEGEAPPQHDEQHH
jgi:hypothetical protein